MNYKILFQLTFLPTMALVVIMALHNRYVLTERDLQYHAVRDSLYAEVYSHHADSIDWHNAELIYQERLQNCK